MAGSTRLACSFRLGARSAAAILKAIVLYSAVSALIFAVLAPRAPQWRLVCALPMRRHAASPCCCCAITAVYAIDAALTEISRVFFVPLALSVVQSFAASTAFAALLIGLLLTPFTPQAAMHAPQPKPPPDARRRPPISRTPRAGSSCRCG